MNYAQLVEKLFQMNVTRGCKMGLSNSRHLDMLLDYPSKRFKTVHVAGTNGKGSVTTKIAAGLEETGKKVGLYTSPHLSCFRERIQVNRRLIPEEEVVKILSELFSLMEQHPISATFFELTTLLAFKYFANQQVDYAVVETGLGGRLDSTNIIESELSIITSITLEHTDLLGSTLEEIAREKAGIIKPGIPVILGPRLPREFLRAIAEERHSECVALKECYQTFEEENQAIARQALEYLKVPAKEIDRAVKVVPPCRMEILDSKRLSQKMEGNLPSYLILDVAHNPDGLEHLFKAIRNKFPGQTLRILFGLSKTKDLEGCVKILSQHSQAFHLVEAPNGRGATVQQLFILMNPLISKSSTLNVEEKLEEGMKNALQLAGMNGEILVVCGTFFIMGPIRKALGFEEPYDIIDMNEYVSKTH